MAEKYPKGSTRTLSVIIPAFNESATIGELLEKVFAAKLPEGFTKEVIVIDDASVDETRRILAEYKNPLKVIRHEVNMGKGASVIDGIRAASGDIAVIQDADLEYDPADWALMLEPILAGRADVVFGSRFLGQRPHRVLYFWHYFGNKTLTLLSNMFSNLNLTDMETCYKMFTRPVIDHIKDRLVTRRFGIEPEITARVKHFRVYEVGISYSGRTYDEGKKIGWKDGFAALWFIVRFNLFP